MSEISSSFSMALRMIAEDLCAGRESEVSLYDFQDSLWPTQMLATLAQHVRTIDPACQIRPLDRTEVTGLSNRGVPFAFYDSSGNERLLQLDGGEPGVHSCKRATEEERREKEASYRQSKRRNQHRIAAEPCVVEFVNRLASKARQAARDAELAGDDLDDFQYHMRFCASISQHSISSAFLGIAQACQVLNITIEQLPTR